MEFREIFEGTNWYEEHERIYAKNHQDVEQALHNSKRSLEDFRALVSPAADAYLEPMAQLSRAITRKRFGKTIQMYIPMYLSNECQNICTYCGFSYDNHIPRKTLSDAEIMQELQHIRSMG